VKQRDEISRDFGFAVRSHPDELWSSESYHSLNEFPMAPEELTYALQHSPETLISELLSLPTRDESLGTFVETRFDGAVDQVHSLCKNDTSVGLQLWNYTLPNDSDDIKKIGLRSAIITGWADCDEITDADKILEKLINCEKCSLLRIPVATLLSTWMSDHSEVLSDTNIEQMLNIVEQGYLPLAEEYKPQNSFTESNDRILNEWPGLITTFLIQKFQYDRTSAAKGSGNNLNAHDRGMLLTLINKSYQAHLAAVPALTQYTTDLFELDSDFTISHVFPLFEEANTYLMSWNSFLWTNATKVSAGMLDKGFDSVIIHGFSHLSSLLSKTGTPVCRNYHLMTYLALSNPSYENIERRDQLMNEVVIHGSPDEFLKITCYEFKSVNIDQQRRSTWEQWLKRYIQQRFNNLPRDTTDSEIRQWCAFGLIIGDLSPQAISFMKGNTRGIDEQALSLLTTQQTNTDDMTDSLKTAFFIELIKETKPTVALSYTFDRYLQKIENSATMDTVRELRKAAYDSGFSISKPE
jgi:hypothetical protein